MIDASGTSALDEARILKERADALRVLRRAGVEPEIAASIAGIEGLKFIPGQPLTIKSPNDD